MCLYQLLSLLKGSCGQCPFRAPGDIDDFLQLFEERPPRTEAAVLGEEDWAMEGIDPAKVLPLLPPSPRTYFKAPFTATAYDQIQDNAFVGGFEDILVSPEVEGGNDGDFFFFLLFFFL